ncbi:uncharacterized protein LOC105201708 isoform X1 [Solenopsis invicta]|uniref:uncharacterized protein LOC105201708 isoform X1 n=2 Tax=Solenopsis invicta TaxID=13686 RepID=UPI00193D4B19|nr:uncharacterized protein LOC105201708 isoform X1 [Solenopsis invicta]
MGQQRCKGFREKKQQRVGRRRAARPGRGATRTKKFVKLAPFKLRFSKMLKSRSSGDSRSNSVESEEQQRQINQSLPSGTDEFADVPEAETDKNCLSVRNEQPIPSSPPPSYEHVLEETRMESSAIALREAKEGDKEKQVSSNEKCTEVTEDGDGGDDDSGGPGGGDRKATKGPKILHKSSKEFYKAMAKQWGITCKMSDHCRCLDCQSHYFDCDYEKDEQAKGDGGLSAGTPMFISEVMHGTACALL